MFEFLIVSGLLASAIIFGSDENNGVDKPPSYEVNGPGYRMDKYRLLNQRDLLTPTPKTFQDKVHGQTNSVDSSISLIGVAPPKSIVVTYKNDSFELSQLQQKRLVKHIGDFVDSCPSKTLILSGFASPPGTVKYNVELAKKRATGVQRFLEMNGYNVIVTNPMGGDEVNKKRQVLIFCKQKEVQ
jgi:outer membrane protein OmpA-like peptidoglycan-associated protein